MFCSEDLPAARRHPLPPPPSPPHQPTHWPQLADTPPDDLARLLAALAELAPGCAAHASSAKPSPLSAATAAVISGSGDEEGEGGAGGAGGALGVGGVLDTSIPGVAALAEAAAERLKSFIIPLAQVGREGVCWGGAAV